MIGSFEFTANDFPGETKEIYMGIFVVVGEDNDDPITQAQFGFGDPPVDDLGMGTVTPSLLPDAFIVIEEPGPVKGDVNCDGVVNLTDISPFATAIHGGLEVLEALGLPDPAASLAKADITGDGVADIDDINPFVALLTADIAQAEAIEQSIRARVPEPGTLALVATGSLMLLRRRRRSQAYACRLPPAVLAVAAIGLLGASAQAGVPRLYFALSDTDPVVDNPTLMIEPGQSGTLHLWAKAAAGERLVGIGVNIEADTPGVATGSELAFLNPTVNELPRWDIFTSGGLADELTADIALAGLVTITANTINGDLGVADPTFHAPTSSYLVGSIEVTATGNGGDSTPVFLEATANGIGTNDPFGLVGLGMGDAEIIPTLGARSALADATIRILAPGDADGDGDVDDDDLSLLLANWGQDTDWAHGEFSGQPPVNDDDLSLLLAHWTGSQHGVVPEPATFVLLLLAAPVLRIRP